MARRPSRQSLSTGVLIVLLAGVLVSQALQAGAHHEPANKYAVAGSTTEEIGPNTTKTILQERMKVSSPFDLVLQVNLECSILTALMTQGSSTGNSTDTDTASGQIEIAVTIDGTTVPVTSADADPDKAGVQAGDNGKVVFCNRTYSRRVTDKENQPNGDGHDEEADFIRTRAANSFDWIALDVGVDCPDPNTNSVVCYDKLFNGNNIVDIAVQATFTTSTQCTNAAAPLGETCADAIVGRRTLVAEPTNLSVHEQVLQTDLTGGS